MQNILEILFLFLIFIGVLALTYFVTKRLAMINQKVASNKNFKVIQVLQLTQGQYLYIVQVGETYHLLGVSAKGSITYCKELDKSEIKFQETSSVSFKEQFSHFMKGKQVNDHEQE